MTSPPSDLILGIESSCDECAAAVVAGGRRVLASVVHSQVAEHAPYRGVVPEIASRSHLRTVARVTSEALQTAGVELDALAGLAVTHRPGLIGSLLVGVSFAKGLGLAHALPLVPVHHIDAHVYSAMMEVEPAFPCLALVVSGGHTALYCARSAIEIEPVASTRDDAAGECFDKVAALLGLPYPGGPSVSRLAEGGDATRYAFPRYQPRDGELGFSFSGLKTAVLYHLRGQNQRAPIPAPEQIPDRQDIAASFQEAAIDVLVEQALAAARRLGLNTVLVTGGVACNQRLRTRMTQAARSAGRSAVFPSPSLCTDNAAMVAGLGFHLLRAGRSASLAFDASPR